MSYKDLFTLIIFKAHYYLTILPVNFSIVKQALKNRFWQSSVTGDISGGSHPPRATFLVDLLKYSRYNPQPYRLKNFS